MVNPKGRELPKISFALVLAGINLVLVVLVLAVPAMLRAAPGFTIMVSGFVTGAQAAQATQVQIDGASALRRRLVRGLLLAGAMAVAAAAVFLPIPAMVATGFAIVAGALWGLVVGEGSVSRMASSGALGYQRFILRRNLLLILATALAGWGEHYFGPGAFLFVPGLVIAESYVDMAQKRRDLGVLGARTDGGASLWLAVAGLAGSLFYRNDVNWVRASVAGLPTFAAWHWALIGYSAVQAVVGVLVVNLVLASRARVEAVVRARLHGKRLRILISALLLGIALALLTIAARGLWLFALALVIAIAVGTLSGVCHASGESGVPYSSGVIGTIVLVLTLQWVRAEEALYLGNAFTLLAMIIGIAVRIAGREHARHR